MLTILAAWFAAAVATAALISIFARTLSGDRRPLTERGRRRRRAAWSQAIFFAVAVALTATQSSPQDWQSLSMVFTLGALALAGDAVPMTLGRYRFTGSFVAIVIAMALMGPAPAVAIGVVCVLVDAIRTRAEFPNLLNNLAAYATFPLAGGVALAQFEGAVTLALGCLVVAVAVNLLNFLVIAGFFTLRDGDSLGRAVRQTWMPALGWEVGTALMAAIAVYGYAVVGPAVVAGLAVSLAVLQILAARVASAAGTQPHILKTP